MVLPLARWSMTVRADEAEVFEARLGSGAHPRERDDVVALDEVSAQLAVLCFEVELADLALEGLGSCPGKVLQVPFVHGFTPGQPVA